MKAWLIGLSLKDELLIFGSFFNTTFLCYNIFAGDDTHKLNLIGVTLFAVVFYFTVLTSALAKQVNKLTVTLDEMNARAERIELTAALEDRLASEIVRQLTGAETRGE